MLANRLQSVSDPRASRRAFLVGGAAAGALVVGANLGLTKGAAVAADGPPMPNVPPRPDAFIRIAPDNTVTVLIKHLDMGQGNATGLATIVADELDADWSQMRTEFAPANAELYNNLAFGPIQGTGGSTAIANSWMQMRKAGAAAKEMMVAAASFQWKAQASEIRVEKGVVSHPPSGRKATFGELATSASTLPVPQEPRLKEPKDWTYIGKRVGRIDTVAKTNGSAVFSLDIRRPGMLTAVVAHPPLFGARPRSFDDSESRKVPGVVNVVQVPAGVAVVARDTFSALKGREALKVA